MSLDLICLFGTAILKSSWLHAFSSTVVNLHLGLSPYYRGSATLFWPFVFRELQYLGTTIHLASKKVDAGAILHRITARLLPGDDYYTITNRFIRDSIDAFPEISESYLTCALTPKQQEPIPGRLCKKADFNEEAPKAALGYVAGGLTSDEIRRIEGSRCRFSL